MNYKQAFLLTGTLLIGGLLWFNSLITADPAGLDGFTEEISVVSDEHLEVVQASPSGKLEARDLSGEIVVVFNHPVVALDQVENTKKKVFEIDPPIDGQIRWYGSRVAAFVPDEILPPAAQLTVKVSAGTKALNGKSMRGPYNFSFTTPDLKIERTYPYSGKTIEYDEKIFLYLNYPVDLSVAEKSIVLLSNGNRHPVDISYVTDSQRERFYFAGPDTKRMIVITPKRDYPRDAEISVILKKGLIVQKGSRPLPRDVKVSYSTYGPLSVTLKDEDRFFQDSYSTGLEFNNPVKKKDLAKALTISPPLKGGPLKNLTDESQEDTVRFVSFLSWQVEPGQSFSVKIDKSLKDAYGNRLSGASKTEYSVKLPPLRADFRAPTGHQVIESAEDQKVPLYAAAMDAVRVQVADVTKYTILAMARNDDDARLSYKQDIMKTGLSQYQSGTFGFDLKKYLSSGQKGWLAVRLLDEAVNYKGKKYTKKYTRIIQSTNLGMTVKETPYAAHVWIHTLSGAEPVNGAKITAHAEKDAGRSGECSTNEEGYCKINKRTRSFYYTSVFFVEHKDDKAYVLVRGHTRYSWAAVKFFRSNAGYPDLRGVVVFDRKLYRPGDTVHFKSALAVIDNDKLNPLVPRLGNLQVSIQNSRGAEVYEKVIEPTGEGGVSGSFSIPKGSPLGHYNIRFSLHKYKGKQVSSIDGFPHQSISDTFQVEEFRPATFSVSLSEIGNSAGSTSVATTISGRYLFGAPMAGADLEVSLTVAVHNPSFANYSDFRFGDFSNDPYSGNHLEELEGVNTRLNQSGKYEFKSNLKSPHFVTISPEGRSSRKLQRHSTVSLTATVADEGKRKVSAKRDFNLFSSNIIPGFQSETYFVQNKKPFQLKLIAVNPQGKSVSTRAKVTIFKQKWIVTDVKGPEGSVTRKSVKKLIEVGSETVRISGKTAYSYTPDEAGSYSFLIETDSSFSRGTFYVSGSSYGFWEPSDDDSIELIPDKKTYNPGDTARILIKSPYKSAQGILTVERQGILHQESFDLQSSSQSVEIKIEKDHLPEVYAGVMLIRPRTEAEPSDDMRDPGKPSFKLGLVKLNISAEQKRLPVKMYSSCSNCKPGQKVTVTIQTSPGAEVALAVSDRAILDLIRYNFQDPVSSFYSDWPHGIRVIESRDALIDQVPYAGKGDRPGGGGGEEDPSQTGGFSEDQEDGMRKDFRHTAYWNPALKASSTGKIEISFKLPDNLTTFRMMALASKDGRYGKTDYEFRVNKPVVLQPLLPRFIRPGDQLSLGGFVVNTTDSSEIIDFGLKFNYLKCQNSLREAEESARVSAGDAKEFLFQCSLDPKRYLEKKPGTIRTEMKAEASVNDGVIQSVPILVEKSKEAFTVTGVADPEQKEYIVLQNPDKNPGKLDLRLSSTVLSGLSGGYEYFYDHPYFCLEQQTSAFLLHTLTPPEFRKKRDEAALSGKSYNFEHIEDLFRESLKTHQNPDGGFTLWSGKHNYPSNPYVTAYVLYAMHYAEKKGKSFDSSVKTKAVRYLQKYMKKPEKSTLHYTLETLTFTNYVLSLTGQSAGSITRFLTGKKDSLSLRAKGYLALTLLNEKSDAKVVQDLYRDLQNAMSWETRKVRIRETYHYSYGRAFYSNDATVAVWVQVLTRIAPDSEALSRMIRSLQSGSKRSASSHSEALSALAITGYSEKMEKTGKFNAAVEINGNRIAAYSFDSGKMNFERSISSEELLKSGKPGTQYPLQFSADNKGRIYYTATLQYMIPSADKPLDEGIEVRRELLDFEKAETTQPFQAGEKSLQRGKVYIVRLTVSNPKPVSHFVLRDPVPSHSEIVQAGFSTEDPRFSRFLVRKSDNSYDYYRSYSRVRQEFRDDAAVFTVSFLQPGVHEYYYLIRPSLPGKAVYPAANAYAMYEPEIFGRTADAVQTVD